MAARSKLWKFECSERGIVLDLWKLEKWTNMVGYLEFFFFTYAMISLKEPSGLDQGLWFRSFTSVTVAKWSSGKVEWSSGVVELYSGEVEWSVWHNFLNGREVILPCSYRSTCCCIVSSSSNLHFIFLLMSSLSLELCCWRDLLFCFCFPMVHRRHNKKSGWWR